MSIYCNYKVSSFISLHVKHIITCKSLGCVHAMPLPTFQFPHMDQITSKGSDSRHAMPPFGIPKGGMFVKLSL